MKNINITTSFFLLLSTVSIFGQQSTKDGSLGHSIPLSLPSGINGMTPKVSLSYNSNSENGVLGVGWKLNAAPFIKRDPTYQVRYNDGYDRFISPQGRIIKKDLTTDEYYLENDPYTTLKSSGNCGSGPCDWVQTQQDGTRLYYGTNNTTAQVRAIGKGGSVRVWLLAKVEDIWGNYYQYSYFQNEGEYYLREIIYGLGNGNDVYRRVLFEYVIRTDKIQKVTEGTPVTTAYLLNEIRIQANYSCTLIVFCSRDYTTRVKLDYSIGLYNKNFLNKITTFASDDTEISSQDFEYSNDFQENLTSISSDNNPIFSANNTQKQVTGDFNGDGRSDIAWRRSFEGKWTVSYGGGAVGSFGDGTNDFRTSDYLKVLVGDFTCDGKDDIAWRTVNQSYWAINPGEGQARYSFIIDSHLFEAFNDEKVAMVGDYDGDGCDDIAWRSSGKTYWTINYSNGHTEDLSDSRTDFDPKNGNQLLFSGDFNGDGKTDLTWRRQGWDNWVVNLGGGGGTVLRDALGYDFFSIWGGATYGISADFDGDGKADIAWRSSGKNNWIVNYGNSTFASYTDVEPFENSFEYYITAIHTGDFDGDGVNEVAWRSKSMTKWVVNDFNSNRVFLFEDLRTDFNPSDKNQINVVGDFNGDGITDFSWRRTSWTSWLVNSSSGDFTIYDGSTAFNPFGSAINDIRDDQYVTTGNFSGNGKTEVTWRENFTGTWNISSAPAVSNESLLTKITTNTIITDIKYASSFNTAPRSSLCGYPVKCPSKVLHLVTGITKTDKAFPTSKQEVTYGYEDLLSVENVFDNDFYWNLYPDVKVSATYGQTIPGGGLKHFFAVGKLEGRHARFRGNFFGFRKLTQTNIQTGGFTETINEVNDIDFAGQPLSKVVKVNGIVTSEIFYDYSNTQKSNSSYLGAVWYVPPKVTLNSYQGLTAALLNSSIQELVSDDQFGNPIETKTTLLNSVGSSVSVIVARNTYSYGDTVTRTDGGSFTINARVLSQEVFENSTAGQLLSRQTYGYTNFELTQACEWLDKSKSTLGVDVSEDRNICASMSYDVFGNIKTTTNAKGQTVTFEYHKDYPSLPSKITSEEVNVPHVVEKKYDPFGLYVIQEIDENGKSLFIEYDKFGRKYQIKNNAGETLQQFNYNDNNKGTQSFYTEVLVNKGSGINSGSYSRKYVDGFGRTYKKVSKGVTDGGGQTDFVKEYKYNSKGQLEWDTIHYVSPNETNPAKTYYFYDALGRVYKKIFPDGIETNVAYAANEVTVTDANGSIHVTRYDTKGRTKEKLDRVTTLGTLGWAKIAYTYDVLDRLAQTVDADGNMTSIEYDSLGRKTLMTEPNTATAGSWVYQYDDANNLLYQKDPKGQVITFDYDALNRLVQKNFITTGDPSVVYSYDLGCASNGNGNLCKVVDSTGSIDYAYDDYGNIKSQVKAIDGKTFTFALEYDIQNKLTQTTYPDGSKVGNIYSETSYLKEVRLKKFDQIWGAPIVTYTGPKLEAGKNWIYRTLGNNVETKIAIDRNTLRPTQAITRKFTEALSVRTYDAVDLDDYSIGYTATGNIETITDDLDSNRSQTFVYDELYRLTKATSTMYGILNYAYTPGGNLTKKGDLTLSYVGASSQAVSQTSHPIYGIKNYSYDGNGNMSTRPDAKSATVRTLEYDSEDRLTKVVEAGTTKHEYFYDHAGSRVKKVNKVTGDITYSISGLYEVLVPGSGGAEVHTKYIFGMNGDLVGQIARATDPILVAGVGLTTNELLADRAWDAFHEKSFFSDGFSNLFKALVAEYEVYRNNIKLHPKSLIARAQDYLLLAFGLTIIFLLYFILREKRKNKAERIVNLNPSFFHRLSPVVLFFAIFQFGFLGCSGTGTLDPVQPPVWGDLTPITSGPANIDQVRDSYNDLTLAGMPQLGALFFVPGVNGSTRLITNSEGKVISRTSYKPYGEIIKNATYTNGPDNFRYKYTGQEHDAETDLSYYRARFYDANLGRFISVDTVIDGGVGNNGFNRYMYVGGDPIKRADPTGHGQCFSEATGQEEPCSGEENTPVDDSPTEDPPYPNLTDTVTPDDTLPEPLDDTPPARGFLPGNTGVGVEKSTAELEWERTVSKGKNYAEPVSVKSYESTYNNGPPGTLMAQAGSTYGIDTPRENKSNWPLWKKGLSVIVGIGGAACLFYRPCRGGAYHYFLKATQWVNGIRVSTPTKGGSNLLPNLFNATGGQQVRLLPSASKHFAEFLGRSQTFTSPLNTRLLYESFNKGLNHAINLGLKYGEKVNVPGWEFIFQKARDGGLPVLIHALPK